MMVYGDRSYAKSDHDDPPCFAPHAAHEALFLQTS